jgi:hypothetical protein
MNNEQKCIVAQEEHYLYGLIVICCYHLEGDDNKETTNHTHEEYV